MKTLLLTTLILLCGQATYAQCDAFCVETAEVVSIRAGKVTVALADGTEHILLGRQVGVPAAEEAKTKGGLFIPEVGDVITVLVIRPQSSNNVPPGTQLPPSQTKVLLSP